MNEKNECVAKTRHIFISRIQDTYIRFLDFSLTNIEV